VNSYGDSAVLVQAGLVSGWGGQQVRDWDNATRKTIACAVQPRTTSEFTDQRQATSTDMVLHCGPEVALRAVDRIEYGGHTYEVEGEPAVHRSFGRADHIEVVLNRIAEEG
jgi:hypothetical protein